MFTPLMLMSLLNSAAVAAPSQVSWRRELAQLAEINLVATLQLDDHVLLHTDQNGCYIRIGYGGLHRDQLRKLS